MMTQLAEVSDAVSSGHRVPLAVELRSDGVQVGQPARRYNPILTHTSINERDPFAPGIWEGTDDLITMSTCAGTHLDALCHISYDGSLYNGYPSDSITPLAGASKLGAEKLPAIVTRGVLLDVARAKGVDGLDVIDQGYAITGEDLEEAADFAGVQVQAGDVVLVRTGEMRHYLADPREPFVPVQETGRWRYAVGTGEARLPGLSVAVDQVAVRARRGRCGERHLRIRGLPAFAARLVRLPGRSHDPGP